MSVPTFRFGSMHPYRDLLTSAIFIAVPATVVGVALATNRMDLAILSVLAVLGLAVSRSLSLGTWCVLLAVSTVVMRGVVSVLQLPSILNFLHYPLVIAFAAAALHRPVAPVADRMRAPGRWLVGLAIVSALSLVANFSHPVRALLFLVIVGEPLLVIWAIGRWGPGRGSRSRVIAALGILLLIQVPVGVGQAIALGLGDPVQGTLVGHGAGAHVLGGLFALGLLVIVASAQEGRIGYLAATTSGLACVVMMFLSNATQVLLAAVAALALVPLIGAWGASRVQGGRSLARLLGGTVVILLVGACAIYLVNSQLPNTLERSQNLARPSNLPELGLIGIRYRSGPVPLLLGSGPGTSASRASILLTPELLKETSPLTALNLPPTEAAREVVTVRNPYAGSAESLPSSILGIIGDLGLIGLAGTIVVLRGIWRDSRRAPRWLLTSARGAILMTVILSFVDTWMEYPEFAIPLAVLIGFAIHPERPPEEVTRAHTPPRAAIDAPPH